MVATPVVLLNVTTKSGSNQYHGDAYEFLRNSFFDANDWFIKRAGNPRAAFRMNQFGGTFGGPLSIPHLYNGKDRTYFFFLLSGYASNQGSDIYRHRAHRSTTEW